MVRQRLVVLIVALGVIAASDSAGQTRSPDARNDEDAIKAVIAATTDAFSRHDAKAWVKFCTSDAQLVTVRGESMNGVAEIEKGLTTIYTDRMATIGGTAAARRAGARLARTATSTAIAGPTT